jgi:dTDP-4-amino-4,6-dideoxygalactose transaminase
MIRLSKSVIGPREKEAVLGVLDREYLGMGDDVRRFEEALTDFFGRSAVCVNTGTAALHLAVQACGIGPGHEVLVPSLTYIASFQAVSATGAVPVACDIDPVMLTLDPKDAEQRITPRTKAVMPVHYSGGVGDLAAIEELAARRGLRVIADAAHAFGTFHRDRRVGSFGDVSCFSFDGIKNITSGEGGCIVTSDEAVLRQVSDARLLGVEKDTEQRYAGARSWEFQVRAQGWRYHMSNIMAAIGLVQLERASEFADKRRTLARRYDDRLRAVPGAHPLAHDYREVVPHIYVVRIDGLRDRAKLRADLLERGIQTGIHYQPNHWLDLYRQEGSPPLSVVDSIYPRILSLPLHPNLSKSDVDRVCDALTACLRDGKVR